MHEIGSECERQGGSYAFGQTKSALTNYIGMLRQSIEVRTILTDAQRALRRQQYAQPSEVLTLHGTCA
jgi:hypothetical protein